MGVEERITICNLSVEMGAKIGMVAPDDRTFEYIAGRRFAPSGALFDRAVEHWRTLPSDAAAALPRGGRGRRQRAAPTVTWGTSPEHAIAIDGAAPDPAAAADAIADYRAADRAARPWVWQVSGA